MPGASIIVIGGGVTGLSAAWWLAKSGHDVLVLEKSIVGWEASGRNGGGASHYHSPLFQEEQRLWPQMDELLGYPTEYQRERIIICLTEQQRTRFRQMAAVTAAMGYQTDELDPRQLRDYVPLAGDNALGAMYLRWGGHANPQRTVQAYAWSLQDHGGRVLQHTPVTGFAISGGRVTQVRTARGDFGCDAVVIAAGPQSGLLAAQLGVHLPLASIRAEMIVTEAVPLMKIGGVDGNGLYGRQTLRGNLAFGGGPHEWIEAGDGLAPSRPSTPLLRHLALRVRDLLPRAAHVRVIRSWAGIVENTPDGRPVLERLSDPYNCVIATMSGVGFGLSPASGHAVHDLVVHGSCTFTDLEKLRLSRFDTIRPDWREAQGWQPAETAG